MDPFNTTTELDAVNYILEMIEEAPLNTLVDLQDPDGWAALMQLRATSLQFQTSGWEFNTEPDYVLPRNALTGQIPTPRGLLHFSAPGESYAQRSGKLYNRRERTFDFSSDVTGTAVFRLDFEDMPEPARVFVVLSAAWSFMSRRAPDAEVARLSKGDVDNAWTSFHAFDTASLGASFSHNQAIQNRPRS